MIEHDILTFGIFFLMVFVISLGFVLVPMYRRYKRWKGNDERAVSPVIGVILMVAITVILSAVIGVFILDLGQSKTDGTPSVSFGYVNNSDGTVTVRHTGGETIPAADLTVKVAGAETASQFAGNVSAGDSVTVDAARGDTVLVVYEQDGDSRILSQYQVP